MDTALSEARAAFARAEVPVGAVLIDPEGRIVAQDGNRTRETCDPTAHAEILVIRAGCAAAQSERLPGYSLYVTLEPCAMCATAIAAARISRLYFGTDDPKSGGVHHGARVFSHSQCHHVPEIYDGLSGVEAEAILKEFFRGRR